MVNKKEFWENKIIGWEDGRYKIDKHNLSILEKFSDMLSSSLRFRIAFTEKLLAKISKDKVIVEVGCGSGLLAKTAIENGAKHFYGYDISELAIERAIKFAEKNNISSKVTFESKAIADMKRIDADLYFSLGTLDWLTIEDVKYLFSLHSNIEFFHSYCEKRNSIAQLLHRFYVYLSYKRNTKTYSPYYMTEKEIVEIFNKSTSFDKNYIYRNPKLSFGAFISTFKLD